MGKRCSYSMCSTLLYDSDFQSDIWLSKLEPQNKHLSFEPKLRGNVLFSARLLRLQLKLIVWLLSQLLRKDYHVRRKYQRYCSVNIQRYIFNLCFRSVLYRKYVMDYCAYSDMSFGNPRNVWEIPTCHTMPHHIYHLHNHSCLMCNHQYNLFFINHFQL